MGVSEIFYDDPGVRVVQENCGAFEAGVKRTARVRVRVRVRVNHDDDGADVQPSFSPSLIASPLCVRPSYAFSPLSPSPSVFVHRGLVNRPGKKLAPRPHWHLMLAQRTVPQ